MRLPLLAVLPLLAMTATAAEAVPRGTQGVDDFATTRSELWIDERLVAEAEQAPFEFEAPRTLVGDDDDDYPDYEDEEGGDSGDGDDEYPDLEDDDGGDDEEYPDLEDEEEEAAAKPAAAGEEEDEEYPDLEDEE